MGSCKINSFL